MPADFAGSTDRSTRQWRGADAVMMLRIQRERLDTDFGDAPGEYLARYGLTASALRDRRAEAVVMHPGPINRGVEIDGALADDPERSLIVLQVEMGVAVRMACLDLLTADASSRLTLSARRAGPANRPRPGGRSRRALASCSDEHSRLGIADVANPLTDRR